jgi:hypothetical protein
MEEQKVLQKAIFLVDEIVSSEVEKANLILADYYSTWYSKNDSLGYDKKGHLMPRLKTTVDKISNEVLRVEIFWNYSGARRKTQHKYSAMKYIKKGKGNRYSDTALSNNTDQEWELKLAVNTEDLLEPIRKRIASLYRIKKATKDTKNIYI